MPGHGLWQLLGKVSFVLVPIHDENPLKRISFQYVTVALIAINVLIYVLFQSGLAFSLGRQAYALAIIPAELLGPAKSGTLSLGPVAIPIPEMVTPLTYMFLHGNWVHLMGNMLFLWVFGDNVEDAMGHGRFLIFFLISGVVAGLTHSFFAPGSPIPLIGASGAVAGVIAAYLMLHPRVWVWTLAFRFIPLRVPAVFVLGFWVVMQVVSLVLAKDSQVAWWAHIGGLMAGAILVLFLRRREVPLFSDSLPPTPSPR